MAMDFDKAGQLIALFEKDYFFTGAFSESIIRDDLQIRKRRDSCSTLGSSGIQTYELRAKKDFYIKEFNDSLNLINQILNEVRTHQSWDATLISRCEKCKNQANKLLGIVRNF